MVQMSKYVYPLKVNLDTKTVHAIIGVPKADGKTFDFTIDPCLPLTEFNQLTKRQGLLSEKWFVRAIHRQFCDGLKRL